MSRILVFTATAGFRHDSIPEAVAALREETADAGMEMEHTEDPEAFLRLDDFDAVVFAQTSGATLNDEMRTRLHRFVQDGGGFAGIHCASTAEPDWDQFPDLVGARFVHHPSDQNLGARVRVEDSDHDSTRHLPVEWPWIDEWYCFDRNPRDEVRVLLSVDESDYLPEGDPSMGEDHPLAWAGTLGEGRTFYTALGHHAWAWEDPNFRGHAWGGILSVLRSSSVR